MKKYIICNIEINSYFAGADTEIYWTIDKWAKRFNSEESAEEKIQELPKGIYEIKTIYVNE